MTRGDARIRILKMNMMTMRKMIRNTILNMIMMMMMMMTTTAMMKANLIMTAIQIWIMNRVKQVKKLKCMIRSTNTDMGITDTSITTKIKVTTQKKIRRKMKAVVLALATAANLLKQYCESSNKWRTF